MQKRNSKILRKKWSYRTIAQSAFFSRKNVMQQKQNLRFLLQKFCASFCKSFSNGNLRLSWILNMLDNCTNWRLYRRREGRVQDMLDIYSNVTAHMLSRILCRNSILFIIQTILCQVCKCLFKQNIIFYVVFLAINILIHKHIIMRICVKSWVDKSKFSWGKFFLI